MPQTLVTLASGCATGMGTMCQWSACGAIEKHRKMVER